MEILRAGELTSRTYRASPVDSTTTWGDWLICVPIHVIAWSIIAWRLLALMQLQWRRFVTLMLKHCVQSGLLLNVYLPLRRNQFTPSNIDKNEDEGQILKTSKFYHQRRNWRRYQASVDVRPFGYLFGRSHNKSTDVQDVRAKDITRRHVDIH